MSHCCWKMPLIFVGENQVLHFAPQHQQLIFDPGSTCRSSWKASSVSTHLHRYSSCRYDTLLLFPRRRFIMRNCHLQTENGRNDQFEGEIHMFNHVHWLIYAVGVPFFHGRFFKETSGQRTSTLAASSMNTPRRLLGRHGMKPMASKLRFIQSSPVWYSIMR